MTMIPAFGPWTEHPAGAVPASDGSAYYFPEDRVTDALTKRGFNRCLNGYIPE